MNKFIFLLILLFGPVAAEPVWADNSASAAIQPQVSQGFQAACCLPAERCSPAREHSRPTGPQASANPQRGTLYRVRYQDHTSYLFGTIHIGRPDFFPLGEPATRAFAEAGTLALELDMRDTATLQSAVKKYGMLADGDTLDRHLSPAGLARLKQALAQTGIPFDGVAHMKAWMVANLLLIAALERQGYHTEQSAETFLLNAAQKQGKIILGLESADFQLSLFDAMKETQQEQFLDENLDDLQSGVALKKTQELVDAWANADEDAFGGLLREAQNDDSTAGKFLHDILLDKRNLGLATGIEALLRREKASFVGIGLLHLIGADGVPQLLARRGYEVTRLY